MTSRWNSYLGQWSLSCFRGKDQGPTTGSTLFHCKKWRDSSFSALSLITASLPHRPSHCHKVGILFRTILATIDLSPLWRLVFVCAWQSAVPGSGWPNWGGSWVVLHLLLLLLLLRLGDIGPTDTWPMVRWEFIGQMSVFAKQKQTSDLLSSLHLLKNRHMTY